MTKKIIILLFLLSPLVINAACPTKGVVPCSLNPKDDCPCQLCHFFVMLSNTITFSVTILVPVMAALMIAIGGFMFVIGYWGGKGEQIETAKKLFYSVVIGLIICYAAWLVIHLFMSIIGVANWTGLKEGWFKINCN